MADSAGIIALQKNHRSDPALAAAPGHQVTPSRARERDSHREAPRQPLDTVLPSVNQQSKNSSAPNASDLHRAHTSPHPSQPRFRNWRHYIHPKPAKQVLSYKFTKTLGQGSMGKVKLAVDEKTGQQVAVKIIPRFPAELLALVEAHHKQKQARKARRSQASPIVPTVMETPLPSLPENFDIEYDPQRELRVLREANTLHLLRHPHVVRLLHHVVTEDYFYLVFEYVPGKQLLDWVMRHGKLSEDLCRHILKQLISGISYCHANSLVHRDLKIENIMLDGPVGNANADVNQFQVKILDFGLSNFYRKDRLLSTFCGSLYFAAPELLQARPYQGPEVDVWSLGVIAFVLLAGKVPFDDVSLPVLHRKIKQGRIDYPKFLSGECVDFLRRMLCVDPRQRATLGELRQHPWMTKTKSTNPVAENAQPIREAPFLLDRLKNWATRDAPSLPNFGTSSFKQKLDNSQTLATDPYLPVRKPLYQLAGCHPNPIILTLLKRSPFDYLNDSDQTQRNDLSDIQNELKSMGFARGFGFDPKEISEILEKAWTKRDGIYNHPMISIYYLLHEWLQRRAPHLLELQHRDEEEDYMDEEMEAAARKARTRRFHSVDGHIQQNDDPKGKMRMYSETMLEAVPQPEVLEQQNSTTNSLLHAMGIASTASQQDSDINIRCPHALQDLLPAILHVLTQEGVSQSAEETTLNSNAIQHIQSHLQRYFHAPGQFIVHCMWRPSVILNPNSSSNANQHWERMSVKWEIHGLQTAHGTQLVFRYRRGDTVVYQRIAERLRERIQHLIGAPMK